MTETIECGAKRNPAFAGEWWRCFIVFGDLRVLKEWGDEK